MAQSRRPSSIIDSDGGNHRLTAIHSYDHSTRVREDAKHELELLVYNWAG